MARFYADLLIEEPRHHWLVTAPANSPENAFRLPDGHDAHVCMGPAVDMQLLPAEVENPEHLTACPYVRIGELEPPPVVATANSRAAP